MTINAMTLAAESLKSFILPGLTRQLNDNSSAFFAMLDKGSQGVSGKEIVMALRYGRIGGFGNRADDATLPTPNPRKTKQAKWETKNLFSNFQITDKTIEASKQDAGAFANLLATDMEDCKTEAQFHIGRQCAGDGTGLLATLTGNSTYNSSPKYISFTVDTTMFLSEGMFVDIYNGASPISGATEAEVILVDDSTNTVRVTVGSDIHASVLSTHCIYLAGNYGLELTGIGAVLSTSGSIYGLSKTTYPWLKPQVTVLSGEISDNAMQKVVHNIQMRTGCKVDFIQCALGVERAYGDFLSANKQAVNTIALKGGYSGLDFKGIPLVGDHFVGSGRMEFLDTSTWKLYDMGDFHWLDQDGAILRSVSRKAAWEGTLVRYCDLGCKVPRGQGLLSSITEH